MSARQISPPQVRLPDPEVAHAGPIAAETRSMRASRYVGATLRLSLGWVFLWAFLDKAFGLGHATPSADAWINGGEPTRGFLEFGTVGPFASIYQSIAGNALADAAFMLGLAGIGIALMLGITMRVAAGAGAIMLILMWTAVLPPANNPFMDDHLVYALVLVGLALTGAGRTLGLGGWWESLPIVRRYGALK